MRLLPLTNVCVGADAPISATGSALQQSAHSWDTLARRIPAKLDVQPEGLAGVHLHEYQMHGLRWLLGLHDLGLHGILADDMGAELGPLQSVGLWFLLFISKQLQRKEMITKHQHALAYGCRCSSLEPESTVPFELMHACAQFGAGSRWGNDSTTDAGRSVCRARKNYPGVL